MQENKRYKGLKTGKWISIRSLVPDLLLTVRSARLLNYNLIWKLVAQIFVFALVRFGCTEKVDIGFILQSSTSIGQTNFDKIKSFVKELVNCFKISQDHARVSILSYASTSTIHFPFSRAFTSSQELNSTIDSISYNGGGTNIGEALATAYSSMFKVNNGARLSG